MNTTIYLIRHSEPMKRPISINNADIFQITNEKNILSIEGERKAQKLSINEELKNIDLVISSNYVRTISTAKYIACENNKEIYIDENFGERKFGINKWDELPENFFDRQIKEPEYKIKNGESQKEVASRLYNSLMNVLKNNKGKRIAIISHGTAITFLFMKLGEYKNKCIYFNNKIVMDESFKWKTPEVFKLEYNDDKLVSIKNIELNLEDNLTNKKNYVRI